jgi:alpha-maltose-1-phosphate synthase
MKVWLPVVRANSGADVFVERLAAGLGRRGVEAVITWFPHWTELVPDLLRFAQVPDGVDVVHANTAYAFAFKRRGIPLVATELHYVLDPAYRPFKTFAQHAYHTLLVGPYLRRSYQAADAVTAISGFTAGVLETVLGVHVTRSIPLWVDADVFSPAPNDLPRCRIFRLLFVGNDSTRKGADVIAPLAAALGSGFEIVCTSGLREKMPCEGAGNVRALGRLDLKALVDAYRDCDAVLVPSRYEGFGYAALEGMSCGKPVVGFDSGAIREVVGEPGRQWLARMDDIEGLAELCRRLVSDPDAARRLGAGGRSRALTTYTEAAAVSSYLAIYSELLHRE